MTRTKPRVRARPKPPPVAEVVCPFIATSKAVKIVAQIKSVYGTLVHAHDVKYWVMMAETGRTFVKAFKTKKSAIAHAKKELYRYKVFNIDPDTEGLVEDTNDDAESYKGHDGGEARGPARRRWGR